MKYVTEVITYKVSLQHISPRRYLNKMKKSIKYITFAKLALSDEVGRIAGA